MGNISLQKVYLIGNFQTNSRWGQLNNEEGGELHELKSWQNGNSQINNIIKSKQISFEANRA